jgi:hypothetical protein
LQLLAEFRLDEFAIEAEAIRSVFSALEVLDRMLTFLESRCNKALSLDCRLPGRPCKAGARGVQRISPKNLRWAPIRSAALKLPKMVRHSLQLTNLSFVAP